MSVSGSDHGLNGGSSVLGPSLGPNGIENGLNTVTSTRVDHATSGDDQVSRVGDNITVTKGASGSRISIGNGSSTIDISKSGHVTISSASGSGITIAASAGKLHLDAPTLSFTSKGSLNFEAASINMSSKGDISLSAPTGNMSVIGRKMSFEADGQFTISATKEFGLTTGGNMRMTVGGSTRIQSTSDVFVDTGGMYKLRANDDMHLNASGGAYIISNETTMFHSKSTMSIRSGSLMDIQSEGSTILMNAGENIAFNADGSYLVRANGKVDMNTEGTFDVKSGGLLKIHSGGGMQLVAASYAVLSSKSSVDVIAGGGVLGLSGATKVEMWGGEVDIDSGSEIHLEMNHATQLSADSPETPKKAAGIGYVQAPEAAHVESAKNIQQELSSAYEQPDVPLNTGSSSSSGGGSNGGGGGSGKGGNGVASNASVGRTTNPGPGGSSSPSPGGTASRNGVDSRLMNVYDCAVSKFQAQTGYKVNMISGYRPGDPRFHGKGMALDIDIYDNCGKLHGNYQNEVDDEAFTTYEVFAHQMKQCQEQLYPGMPFRWGGYFWNGGRGGYGAMDTMHFDIGDYGTGGGSWDGGANGKQLNEWGLSSGASQGYTGAPNYSRLPKKNCGGEQPANGDDRWEQAKNGGVDNALKQKGNPHYEQKR